MSEPKEKVVLTISRKWHSPAIKTTVSHEGISVECELPDFIEAVIEEIGPVTWVFTDSAFKIKMGAAVERVLQGIKEETAKAV